MEKVVPLRHVLFSEVEHQIFQLVIRLPEAGCMIQERCHGRCCCLSDAAAASAPTGWHRSGGMEFKIANLCVAAIANSKILDELEMDPTLQKEVWHLYFFYGYSAL